VLVLAILILILLVSAAVTSSMAHQLHPSSLGTSALFLSFGLVGLVVAWHQPGSPMGWVLLGVTFFYSLGGIGTAYAYLDYRLHGGRLPLGWVSVLLTPSWAPAIVLAALALLLFPDGRLPSRRWRPMLWAYLALGLFWLGGAYAISAGAIISHHVSIDSAGDLAVLDNPAGSDAWWGGIQAIFFPAVAVCWLVWLTGQVLRYRHASGERRLQMKWLLSGATLFVVAAIALVSAGSASGWWQTVVVLATIGSFALPVSLGFGILKFRLYDIDRIISRTVAYAVVTGLLVGLYAGLVLLATQVLRFHGPAAVALSTLVAAAVFNPLRRRVQRTVDRRFNRARYDAERTVAAFTARLQDHVELGEVRADLLDVVNAALEPAHLSVWTTPAGPRP